MWGRWSRSRWTATVEQEIFAEASKEGSRVGIELLDIDSTINYNESVPEDLRSNDQRTRQIAERFLSEGNGEAARIRGNRVRDLKQIQPSLPAGGGDPRHRGCEATQIYAGHTTIPEAVAFYEFTRTMQSYKA